MRIPHPRTRVAWTWLFLAACSSDIARDNPNDPDGTGPKNPGRLAGTVFIQGYSDPSSFAVHVFDAAEVELGEAFPNAAGEFTTGDLPAGTGYRVVLDVPVENTPAVKEDITVEPGVTKNIGLLSSIAAPPVGQIAGVVTLENLPDVAETLTESFANIRVVASKQQGAQTVSWVQYTGPTGNYLFTSMPAGDYEIRADREKFTPDFKDVRLGSGARDLVDAPPMQLYPASAVVRFSVPTQNGAVIGAPYTSTRDVELLLFAFGGVNEMRFSEAEDFVEGGTEVPWRPHLGSVAVTLSPGEGSKEMFAQFRVFDTVNQIERLRTDPYSASVVLDQSPPEILSFSVGQDAPVRNGVIYITGDTTSVPVRVSGIDTFSAIDGVKLVLEGTDPGFFTDITGSATVNYQTTVPFSPGDGPRPVAVQLRDRAGNTSTLRQLDVVVDNTPPLELASPGVLATPAVGSFLASQSVLLTFLVGGDEALGIDGPLEMAYGVAPAPQSPQWSAFSTQASLTLTQASGTSVTFYAHFRDAAGNILELESAAYTLKLEGAVRGRVFLEGQAESAPAHGGTLVEAFLGSADPDTATPLTSRTTLPDGTFTIDPLPAGTYQLRYSRTGAVTTVRAPIVVQNAQDTSVGVERLRLARGSLAGVFKYGDERNPTTGNHGGITVSAVAGGVVVATAITDETGAVSFTGLPVGSGYTIRASAEGFAARTLTGVLVAQDVVSPIAGGIAQFLLELVGDFKLCNLIDPPAPALPADCAAALYTNEDFLLLGLAEDPALVTHVRYVLEDPANPGEASFTQPSADPATGACATPPQEDCWNVYDPADHHLVSTGGADGVLTYVVQFWGADGLKQAPGISQIIYDTEAPLSPVLRVARGARALAEGYTHVPQVGVSFSAQVTSGLEEEAAPLEDVRVSNDGVFDGAGVQGDRVYTYGAADTFDLETASGNAVKAVYAWICDAAKNCAAAAPVTMVLDGDAPQPANGVALTPSGQGIVAHPTLPRTFYTRGVVYGVDVSLGDSGLSADFGQGSYAIPEIAAYQISTSPTFAGSAWVVLDTAAITAGAVIPASGLGLQPVDATYPIYARVQDLAGNVSTGSEHDFTLILDRQGPVAQVSVGGGAVFTNDPTLSAALSVNPIGDAVLLQYAVDAALPEPYPSPDTRSPFVSSLAVPLTAPSDGPKSVRVRLFDVAGNFSEVEDSIILDRTPPQGGLALCDSCSTDPAGVSYYNSALAGQVRLFVFANDALAGLGEVRVTVDGGTLDEHVETATYAPYVPVNVSSAEGLHSVAVRFVDNAGNASAPVTLALEYDSLPPTLSSVSLQGGAPRSKEAIVSVSLSADDQGDPARLRGMYVSNSATFADAALRPYTSSFVWTLDTTTGDGDKEVFVRVVDYAGNTASRSAVIALDRGLPSLSMSLQGLLADGTTSSSLSTSSPVTVLLAASDAGTTDPALLDVKIVGDPNLFATTAWSDFAASTTVALPGATDEGFKTLYAQLRDEAGNVTAAQASILLDLVAPAAPALTFATAYTATLANTATVSVSGATQMCFHGDLVGSPADACAPGSTAWEGLSGSKSITLTGGTGQKTVSVRFRDAARRTVDASTVLTLDTSAPVGALTINSGAAGTTQSAVTLSLSATDTAPASALRMAIANETLDCDAADYEPFAAARAWELADTDGLRTVVACVKDPAGNRVQLSDTIALDRTPPLAPSLSIAGGAEAIAAGTGVTLTLSAGGASRMCISGDLAAQVSCADESAWVDYATSATVDLEPVTSSAAYPFGDTRAVTVLFRDAARNLAEARDTILLDPFGPTSASFTAPGGTSTRVALVTLSASASGASELCLTGDFVGSPADCGQSSLGWTALSAAPSLTLTDPDGQKVVTAYFRDALGRTAGPLAISIALDRAAPSSPTLLIDEDAAATSSRAVALTLQAGGAVQLAVANGALDCGTASYEPMASSKPWLLEDLPGTRTVTACFKDAAGNVSSDSDTIELDRDAPTLAAVSINGGALFTTSDAVTLTLGAAGASRMCIDGDLAVTLPCEPYGTSKAVTLLAGDGPKTVFVSFLDAAGNSVVASTSIVLDTESAYGEQVTLAPSPYTRTTSVTASLNASGAAEMCLHGDLAAAPADDCSTAGSTGWESFTPTKVLTLSSAAGPKTVRAKYRDGAGQESGIATATVTLDGDAPAAASLVIDAGAAATGSRQVTLTLAASDSGSGLARLAVANESITCASATYGAYAGSLTWSLEDSDGTRSVRACIADNAGNVVEVSDTIELDRSAPTGASLAIRVAGADVAYVRGTSVDLALAAAGATELCLFGDLVSAADCSSPSGWQAMSPSLAVSLIGGDGAKIVSVRFRDAAGNTVQASDSVTLDTEAPSGASVVLQPSDYTRVPGLTARLAAAGATQMCLHGDNGISAADCDDVTGTAWETFATVDAVTLAGADGVKTLNAKFRDAAGGVSSVVTDTVVLDTLAPTAATLGINAGAAATNGRGVTLTLSASDATSGLSQLAVQNGPSITCSSAAYGAYTESMPWTLTDLDGQRFVSVCFKDAAGHTSTASASIILDRVAPTGVDLTLGGGAPIVTSSSVSVQVAATDATSSALSYRISDSGAFSDSGWTTASTASFPVSPAALNLADGTHTRFLWVRDEAGNLTSDAATIVVDTGAPELLSAAFEEGASTKATSATLRVRHNGATQLRLTGDLSAPTPGSWLPISEYTSVTLLSANADNVVTVELRDAAGNLSTPASLQASIYRDTTAPSGVQVVINNDEAFTASRNVVLALSASDAGTAHGPTRMAIGHGIDCNTATYSDFSAFAQWTLLSGNGTKVVTLCLQDAAGNIASDTDTIELDATRPAAVSLTLNGGTLYATSSTVSYALAASDDLDLALDYQLLESPVPGDTWTASSGFPIAGNLTLGDGSHTYYLHVRDDAGNVTSAQAQVVVDTVEPTNPTLTLSPTTYTSGAGVTAALGANNATQMCLWGDFTTSSSDACATSGWESFAASKSLTLSAGDGVKTVSAKFRDGAGNTTTEVSDSVIRDGTAPTSPSLAINTGEGHAGSRSVSLALSAADSGSGVLEVAVGNETLACAGATYEPYATTKSWQLSDSDGLRTVVACFRDGVGNTASASDSITLDRLPPSGITLTLAGGSGQTTSTTVPVSVAASDATSSTLEYVLSPAAALTGGETWTAVAASSFPVTPAPLTLGEGTHTYYVFVRDGAKNLGTGNATITVDVTRPTLAAATFIDGAITGAASATLRITASGATQMRLSGDLSDGFAGTWVSFSELQAVTLASTNADNSVLVEVRDAAGNQATAGLTASIYKDTAAPVSPTLVIQGGQSHTSTRNVTLTLASSDSSSAYGARFIAIADGATLACASASYVAALASTTWSLPAGDGGKSVTACFKDAAGNTSSATGSITLDVTAPASLSLTLNGGSSSSTSSTVPYTLGASDNLTATPDYQLTTSATPGASWSVLTTSPSSGNLSGVGEGERTYYLHVRDQAGNVSTLSRTIIVDTEKPSSPAIALSPATYAPTADVTVSLGVNGATQMCLWGDFTTTSTDACVTDGWQTLAASKAILLTAGDGQKTINARFRDAAGNVSDTVTARVTRDGSAPAAPSVTINGGEAFTGARSVTLALSASDTSSSVTAMAVGNESLTCASATYEPYATTKTWLLSDSDGLRTVVVCFKDGVGNSVSGSDSITLDRAPPTGVSLTLAGGASSSTSSTVSVSVGASDATSSTLEYVVTPSASLSGSETWTAAPLASFPVAPASLTLAEGTHTYHVFVRDGARNLASANDTVSVDTTRPVLVSVRFLDGSLTGAATATLQISSAGATEMQLTGNLTDSFAGTFTALRDVQEVTLQTNNASNTITVQVRDAAGNTATASKSASIYKDTTAPQGPLVTIQSDASHTSTRNVTLSLSTSDGTSPYGVRQIAAVDGASLDCATATYTSATSSLSWTLPVGDGGKSVTVCFKDEAGNYASDSDSITLDGTAPTGLSLTLGSGGSYHTSTTLAYSLSATDAIDTALEYELTRSPTPTGTWAALTTPPVTGNLTVTDGERTYYLHVRDDAGNVATSSRTVTIDTEVPLNAAMTLTPSTYTTDGALTLALSATGATELCLWGDFTGSPVDACIPASTAWQSYTTSQSLTATTGNTLKAVNVKFRDDAGNESTTVTRTVTRDGTPPTLGTPAIRINGGASHTSSRTVTLTLSATDAVSMALANASTIACASATYVTYEAERSWVLPSGDGDKPVIACFKDAAGNSIASAAASIALDATSPTGVSLTLASGNAYATTATFGYSGAASDADTNLEYELTTSPFPTGSWTVSGGFPIAGSLTLVDGLYTYYLHVRDDAGNVSTASDSVTVDTVAPSNPGIALSPADYATTAAVEAALTANDVTQMCMWGDYTASPGDACAAGSTGWITYAAARSISLTVGNGLKTINVKFRDAALNTTETKSATVTRDGSPPTLGTPAIRIAGGADYTNSRSVDLELDGGDAVQMAIVDAATISCANETPIPYERRKPWTLPSGEGTKSISVCFYDVAGNPVSSSASIVLDTDDPDAVTLTLIGGNGNEPAGFSTNPTVNFDLSLSEENGTSVTYAVTTSPTVPALLGSSAPLTAGAAAVSGTITLDGGEDNTQAVYVHARDAAGNITTSSAQITVDTIPPVLTGVGVLEAVSTPTGLGVTAEDLTLELFALGANEVFVNGSLVATIDWESFESLVGATLLPGDGSKMVQVWVRDAAQNESNSVTVNLTLDSTPPSIGAGAITLEGRVRDNAVSTTLTGATTVDVRLDLAIPVGSVADIKEIQLSESSDFAGAAWVSYQSRPRFVLSAGDGAKTVYVRARDHLQNTNDTSAARAGTITLDQTPPVATSATPREQFSRDLLVVVDLSASDDVSASTDLQYQIRTTSDAAPATEGLWTAYGTGTFTFNIRNTIFVGQSANIHLSVRDQAGNVAAFPTPNPVIYDWVAPSVPTLQFVESLNRAARLSWSASTDNIAAGTASYLIQFAIKPEGDTCDAAATIYTTTVAGSIREHLLVSSDSGIGLDNKRQYCFRLLAVDYAGNISNPSAWDDTPIGWTVLPVVSSSTAVLVPQGIAYHQNRIFLLYHEQSVRTGFPNRVASTAKLAISEDGGESWRVSLVQLPAGDPDWTANGPVPGRVNSELTVGARGISVITVDWASATGTMALVDYYTEDEGLSWRRATIDSSIGDARDDEFPLTVAGTGSSRTVAYTKNVGGLLELTFRRSADDVRDEDGMGNARWWRAMGAAAAPHSNPGRHLSACNANYVDRLTMSIGNPRGRNAKLATGAPHPDAIRDGQAWTMLSPYHGNFWEPINPNGQTSLPYGYKHGLNLDDPDYFVFTELACEGLGDVEWAYLFASVQEGGLGGPSRIKFKARTRRPADRFPSGYHETVDAFARAAWDNTWAEEVDLATPMAAWAGLNKVYAAYRTTGGDAVVRIGTNTRDGQTRPDGTVCNEVTACFDWLTNTIDTSGDAGFNPVLTGYNDGSPLVAYTDVFGRQIKIARAAVVAPQTTPHVEAGAVRLSWGSVSGSASYAVTDVYPADMACQGTESTYTASSNQIEGTSLDPMEPSERHCYDVQARDANGQVGDAAVAWHLKPFYESVVVDERVVGPVFEDYFSGSEICPELDWDKCDIYRASDGSMPCQWQGPIPPMDGGTCVGRQSTSNTITSQGSAVATLGNMVAVLPPIRDRVWVYVSIDNGNSFGEPVEIYYEPGLDVAKKDMALSTNGGEIFLHIVFERLPVGGEPFGDMIYKRMILDPNSGDWGIDIEEIVDEEGGRYPDVAVSGDVVAIAYSSNRFREAQGKVQLRYSHGEDPQPPSVLQIPAELVSADPTQDETLAPTIADIDVNNKGSYIYFLYKRRDYTVNYPAGTYVLASTYYEGGENTAYSICSPSDCAETALIAGARNSQLFTVFMAGPAGLGGQDKRVRTLLASQLVADIPVSITEGGGLWTLANISANEQLVLFNSLAVVGNTGGGGEREGEDAGTWAVFSTCSELGLNTVWKLNLAYCNSGCQAMENWVVDVVAAESGTAGLECAGEWFGALDISLDPVDKELFIGYFHDADYGEGTEEGDSYRLLYGGYLGKRLGR